MKHFFFIALILCGTTALFAEKTQDLNKEKFLSQKGITITYPGWKLKALSFSFDDGNIADRRLISIFNQYGMKATFHIPAAWLKTKPKNRITEKEISTLYAGHEISGHGANHLNMTAISIKKAEEELDQDIKEWKRITGKTLLGYAYPYGRHNPAVVEAVKKRGMIYSRPVYPYKKNFDLPDNFLYWTPQVHLNGGIDKWANRYLSFKPVTLSVLLVWGHSYEFNQLKNWHIFESFCKKMSGKKDIYYATMAEIASYALAVRALKITHDGKHIINNSERNIFFIKDGKRLILEPGKQLSSF